jgi:hypothetical protein
MKKLRLEEHSVFVNVPYDKQFEELFLAYIVGLVELGLTPKATLAIPGGVARLDRIFDLIRTCRYSIHDLSRVELDVHPPQTPRFNMPFELGLTVGWAKVNPARHTWFVCESTDRRAQKSISDLNGTDFNIHDGTPQGVMRELRNCFVRSQEQPSVPQMMKSFRRMEKKLGTVRLAAGTDSVYIATVFEDLVALSGVIRDERVAAARTLKPPHQSEHPRFHRNPP